MLHDSDYAKAWQAGLQGPIYRQMKDLKSARMIWLKAILFLAIGGTSAALLWAELPGWRTAGLLILVIWSFCRLYYFAFYVLEKYVDPRFRYAGLFALLRHLLGPREPE